MGSHDSAQKEAEKAERERRAQVEATQKQIESIYSSPSREADIKDLIAATQQYLGQDLDKQNNVAQRQAKFALARNGQTMGSYDADLHRDLGQQYLRGALEVTRRAQGAGNALRSADQQAKLDLFSQAAAGMDMTTASRNAAESMKAAAGMTRADALQSGLGDLFGTLSEVRKNSLETQGKNQAEKYQYGSTPYTPNQYFSAASGYGQVGPR